jgi:enamine deaminase RidA (YjgF/YER057c/UK114 family)
VRAGDWIFVSGLMATDARGALQPALTDWPLPLHGEPRHKLEAGIILERAHDILAAGGGSFATVLRTDQFYPDWRPVDHFQSQRRRWLGSYIPPSTSILQAELLVPGAGIDFSMMAVAGDPNVNIETFFPAELEVPAGAGFTPVVRHRDFVFVAGFMAAHQPGDLGGIAPQAQVPSGHLWKGTRIKLETAYLIERKLLPALQSAGASQRSVLKAQVYLADMNDAPAFNEVWRQYFADSPPAMVIVPTSRPGFAIEDAKIEINVIALREGGETRRAAVETTSFGGYVGQPAAVRAGDLLFISGLMAIDQNGPVFGIAGGSTTRYLGACIEQQMEHILDVAVDICSAAGTSLRNIVSARQFHTSLEEFYPAYKVWNRWLPSQPLPLSAVRIPGPLSVPDCTVLLDICVHIPSQ